MFEVGRIQNLVAQIVKYAIVGILNTVITAFAIWLVLYLLAHEVTTLPSNAQMIFANVLGYALGLLNSFVLNRCWTFKSRGKLRVVFVRFIAVFLLCYFVQLGVVMVLTSFGNDFSWQISIGESSFTVTSAYCCQLLGMICFTVLNFILNKCYTFRVGTQ